MRSIRPIVVFLCALGVLAPSAAAAQSRGAGTLDALARWMALDASPVDAVPAGEAVRAAEPRWQRDASDNLVLRVGQGRPRRVVACGLDPAGLVVSQITDAGYLRVHRAGRAAPHPLWEQAHEGQQIEVLGARGAVPGVFAIANGHFARQHRGDTTVVGADQLWLDVGARSRAEVEAMGVELLDPVRRRHAPWIVADHVVGNDAAGRAGCAAVASVAAAALRQPPARGETLFVLSTRRAFNWAGLYAAVARHGPVDSQTVVAGADTARLDAAVRRRALPDGVTLSVRARHPGTLVEAVRAADADSLLAAVREAAGLPAGATPWTMPAAPTDAAPRRAPDAHTRLAALLDTLVALPGVPGHEAPVRAAVLAALPAWARAAAVVDSAGNVVVAAGPDRDTVVAVAHMDEVSWTVASIGGDGTVALTARGGVIPSAWEGQPALLHVDGAASIPGAFVPRAPREVSGKRPAALRAWFGLDSAALVARGVRVGAGVTATKGGVRLGATRYAARSLDDRAGTAALLLAARALDPARLTHKVILAWSVREEGGLEGARALAERVGASVRRAYAIDTFVSSDTPLESPVFAHAPLGAGAVLRGLDDGMAAGRAERARVRRLAAAAGIPLQVGTTHGSTDAGPFVDAGAPGMGLSWPGRYSHSPAEVLDLRDLAALARLLALVIAAP
ncbi:M20/M25/M40 family metallo-hydrolase [Roseisolibacter agri]|uniref:M20/M25/M40 family metallo-hydrolase n=1 Tax=Roseisolibacter agri TaxID=2014610 RepID=A0AA37QBQ0_9BACT|nr:M20/M25/M40 family metallo-hydrolase [Roseisolibacter agri]GLC26776.1 hypothetical protein rosag_32890 [Roseisolibacter agri]